MKIELFPAHALNEKGQRDYNQDSIYPAADTDSPSRFYLVCDGVGGSSRGDVASKILCDTFASVLKHQTLFSESQLQDALESAVSSMNSFIKQTQEGQSMASTLTFIGFGDDKVTIGHVGDSRVYHIRDNRILFCTKDHSLMNEWIEKGVITPEEAKSHPKRNHVTRAVVAGEKTATIETHFLEDIQPNDYFFLCSDGILEGHSDESLLSIVNAKEDDTQKIESLNKGCKEISKDNYSCYLLKVKAVHFNSTSLEVTDIVPSSKKKLLLFLASGFVVLIMTFILFSSGDEDVNSNTIEAEETENMESALEELRSLDTLSLEAPVPATEELPND